MRKRRWLGAPAAGLLAGLLLLPDEPVRAHIEAPYSLGQIVQLSSHIVLMRVKSIDRTRNAIIYEKVRDVKGAHKQTEIRHNIGSGGDPREWQAIMRWAEVGKPAMFFHNGSSSETCIDEYWYQTNGNANDVNGWWAYTHGEPYLLRSYCGRVDKLLPAVEAILAGREVVVPTMVDGPKEDMKNRKGKIQRVRASLKLDYNPKRDFVGWGNEDFRRLAGMPGFTHLAGLTRVDPDAQSVSCVDFNGDGKLDLCLGGSARVALLQNSGDALGEVGIPGATGCRAAVWADYNGDGLPDLLLATPTGPRLYTNLGKGELRDDSHLLPREPGYNLTGAAWIDHDSDGRPDILLANGWYGLRLYRNQGKSDHERAIALGPWRYIGPFDNTGNRGFAAVYPPEKSINLQAKYPGVGEPAVWREGKFTDGQVNSLQLFKAEVAVVYLHREIRCKAATLVPVSLGSDDGLVVWLNGKRLVSANVARACAPDQHRVTLRLNAGKNDLLMKVNNTGGPWAFYFRVLAALPPAITWTFADVSEAVGLGENGVGGSEKGDSLTVGDLDGDGRPDFVYGAGDGVVARNAGGKFAVAKATGIAFRAGRVGPVLGDFDGDGRPDLFVAGRDGLRLFRNEGGWKFTEVTRAAGLAEFAGVATSAAWGDVDNDGRPDLVVGCLRGPNRYLRNAGGGKFEDASERVGLTQRVFNTQAVCLADLNGDGVLDMVFNNEGQDACVLLGNPEAMAKRVPVTLTVAAKKGVTGSVVRVLDSAGRLHGSHAVSGGDGRGGQAAATARFALLPGAYRVELRLSHGERRWRALTVDGGHVRGVLDESMARAE